MSRRGAPKPLPAGSLSTPCDPSGLGFGASGELPDLDEVVGQERAIGALKFAVRMDGDGYNVFAFGAPSLGKLSAVRQILSREAATRPPASDWCYVNNFEQPHRPRALHLPPGEGRRLRADMGQLLDELANAIPAAFESEHYQSRVHELEEEFKERQANAINALREEARSQHVALMNTPAGFAFAPMDAGGETLRHDEFNKLPRAEQERLEAAVNALQEKLQRLLRQFPLWAKEAREKVKALNREIAEYAVGHLIDAIRAHYKDLPAVLEYLDAVRADVIDRVDEFRGESEQEPTVMGARRPSGMQRYSVNVVVDNGVASGAPVVYEDLPTHGNLCGRTEHQAYMGTLVTDFSLIKAGDLHRANGGYLILEARAVLTQPYAWESLKRTLKSREIRIESLEHMLSLISTTSLEPEPVPLEVKVVLLGEPLLYYLLLDYDPDFRDLFKVAAEFESEVDRGPDMERRYAALLATLARRDALRPFGAAAIARLIDHCAREAGDAGKLSTHFGELNDLLRESDHFAGRAGRECVARADVQGAIDARIHRVDRLRERLQEEIRRGTLRIDTEGGAVGQVNGLSVIDLGSFAFGRPSRITATVRLGEGSVIDIERETELGGPIHSKGVLILSGFLAARYAPGRPLSMAASLVFEQSYGMVEGDSASLAELCALLSALAEAPVRQGLAITGSVDQHGRAQAIGGVNEKIEGFFEVCRAAGLDGEQGVLIPASNVRHLMLRDEVVEAAAAGRFHVYPVASVDEAIALLTGLPAGTRTTRGSFQRRSLNGRVEARLLEMSALRESFGRASGDGKAGTD